MKTNGIRGSPPPPPDIVGRQYCSRSTILLFDLPAPSFSSPPYTCLVPLLEPPISDMCQIISDLHTYLPYLCRQSEICAKLSQTCTHLPYLGRQSGICAKAHIRDWHTYLPYLGPQSGICAKLSQTCTHTSLTWAASLGLFARDVCIRMCMCVMVYMSVYLCTVRNQSTQV
jgi:hypothetical protein